MGWTVIRRTRTHPRRDWLNPIAWDIFPVSMLNRGNLAIHGSLRKTANLIPTPCTLLFSRPLEWTVNYRTYANYLVDRGVMRQWPKTILAWRKLRSDYPDAEYDIHGSSAFYDEICHAG